MNGPLIHEHLYNPILHMLDTYFMVHVINSLWLKTECMAIKVLHKFVHICVTLSTTVKIVVFAFFVAIILCTRTVADAMVITICLAWQFNKMYHYQQVIIITVSSCFMWRWHDCITNYFACSIWATPHLSPLLILFYFTNVYSTNIRKFYSSHSWWRW